MLLLFGFIAGVADVAFIVVVSHLFPQQLLFMKQSGVTIIFNGEPQPFLRNRTNDE